MDQNTQPPSQVPPPTPKQNSGILIGILIFFLGILVGMTLDKTTLFSAIRIPYLTAAPTPTLPPLPTTTPTPNPTANWKTYTNSVSFYTLKYPTIWQVIEKEQLRVAGPFLVSATEWNLSTPNDVPNIKITVYKSDSDLVKSMASEGTNVVVGEKTATKNTIEEPTFTISYMFTNSAYAYLISLEIASKQELSQYEPLFNQILSTFRFIESSTTYTCPPSGWADCMPSPNSREKCTEVEMNWYKAHCPDFKGGAL